MKIKALLVHLKHHGLAQRVKTTKEQYKQQNTSLINSIKISSQYKEAYQILIK
jgi:hypothetical protein